MAIHFFAGHPRVVYYRKYTSIPPPPWPPTPRYGTSHMQGLYNLPDIFINNNPHSSAMNKEYLTHTVRVNTKIIDSGDNWNLLLYKEAYHIKRQAPSLNNGLKASRELCLFS